MEINRLRLNQYRSYAALDLRPGPGMIETWEEQAAALTE